MSVGGVQGQQIDALRRSEEAQQVKALAKTGAGNIAQDGLSVSHSVDTQMMKVKGAAIGAIATPKEGALDALNKMDSSTLEATISGLRSQTDEIQSKFQQEVVTQNKERVKNFRDKKLQQMKNQLESLQKGNKCQNVMQKILPLAVPNILIKLGTSLFSAGGKNKSNDIQNEMMLHKYGSKTGAEVAQFKEDYKQVAAKETGVSGEIKTTEDKTRLHQKLDTLHNAGAMDDVTHYELGQMIDGNNMNGVDIDSMLVDQMMGEKQPLLAPENYPEGMLKTADNTEETSTDSNNSIDTKSTNEGVDAADQDNKAWLAKLAVMMQQQEEEAQGLSKIMQEIEEGKTAVLQSNQNAQLQMVMPQRMI